jgi:hypothetical protein
MEHNQLIYLAPNKNKLKSFRTNITLWRRRYRVLEEEDIRTDIQTEYLFLRKTTIPLKNIVRLYPCTLSRTHPLATRTKGSNDSRSRESAVEYLITLGPRHCLRAQRQPWQGLALTNMNVANLNKFLYEYLLREIQI